MGSRIVPEDNRIRVPLLLKSQPLPDEIPPILTAIDLSEVGRKNFPVNLKIESEPAVRVGAAGDATDVMMPTSAEMSKRTAQTAIGYRAGGRKMKSVIPKRRKLVKTMIYHLIKNFVASLFRPPQSACSGTPVQSAGTEAPPPSDGAPPPP